MFQKPNENPIVLQPSINEKGEPEMIPLSRETEEWITNTLTDVVPVPPPLPPSISPVVSKPKVILYLLSHNLGKEEGYTKSR